MKVNILGFGTMGRQICSLLEASGFTTSVWTRELSEDHQRRYRIERKVCFKNLQIEEPSSGNVQFVSEIEKLEGALTIEALSENLAIKHDVIGRLPFSLNTYLLLTNSSSWRPEEVHLRAEALHFFNPVSLLKIIETSLPIEDQTSPAAPLLTALQRLDFQIVPTKGNPGHVGNFVLFQEIGAALRLVDTYQYSPEVIDAVLKGIGRPASLFEVIDFIGVDVVVEIFQNLSRSDPYFYVSPLLHSALSAGILGRKNRTSFRKFLSEYLSNKTQEMVP